MVLRHCAILGSTGSGKSNTTVSILKAILNDYKGSRVILVDPHGEYATAFPDAKVFKINDAANPLFVPFWLMNFDELAFFLVGAKPTDDQRVEHRLFRELVTNLKRANFHLAAGDVDINFITADAPIPFSPRELWGEMNWLLNATFSISNKDDQTRATAKQIEAGNYETLKAAKFEPYPPNNQAPFKSKHVEFYSYEKKILTRLKDSRYDYLFNPGNFKGIVGTKDLHNFTRVQIMIEKA